MRKNGGIGADAVVNVWHVQHLLPLDQSHANKITGEIGAFYTRLAPHLGQSLSRGLVHTVDLATLTPGAAGPGDDTVSVLEWTAKFNLTTVGTGVQSLPSEVACCLSFQGETADIPEEEGATRPASRRRGRLYIGPFMSNVSTIEEKAPSLASYVSPTLRTNILNSYETCVENMNSLAGPNGMADVVRHVIYSPTTGLTWPVQDAWVDDTFDIVRSRGEKTTARTSVAISQPAI